MTEINKEKENAISQEILQHCFSFNTEIGKFYWRITSPNGKYRVGDEAGSINSKGYSVIKRKGKIYLVHRLVWLYTYGKFPEKQIDHINGDKTDNRLINLREATAKENMNNIPKREGCSSKYKGVYWDSKRSMFRARIVINKKPKCLGFYTTEEEAYKVWCQVANELHGEFVNLGEFIKEDKYNGKSN